MKLLLLNTCGGAADAVALIDTEAMQPIAAAEALPGRTSSEQVLPALKQALDEAGWSLSDLDGVVTVSGPGSFTGVRVGLSVAKGLCEALALPFLACSRLALLAGQAGGSQPTLALLDAGRGEYFAGFYAGRSCERETLLRGDQVVSYASRRLVVVSEPELTERLAALSPRLVPEPDPLAILGYVQAEISAKRWSDVATADANYQRRTDAELLVERQTAVPW